MINKERLNTELKELFNNIMDDAELIECWNEYCGYVRSENEVYYMDDFEDICYGMNPFEVVEKCYYGHFNPNNTYFKFNEYANFDSFSELLENIYIDEMIDYIIRTEKDLWNQDIEFALRDCEYEEEYEEEEEIA